MGKGFKPIIGNFVKLDAITVVNGQYAYTMQNGVNLMYHCCKSIFSNT